MLTPALFVLLCCQQIDGAAAQIDRSRLSQPLVAKGSKTLSAKKAWEGKSVVRKTLNPLQLALCHFGVRRQPIMPYLSRVCGAALKYIWQSACGLRRLRYSALVSLPLRAELLSLISARLIFVPSVLSVSFASSVWFQSPWTGWGFGVVAKWHSAEERWQSAHTREEFGCTHSTSVSPTVCHCFVEICCWPCVWWREREREPVVVGVRTKQPATRGLGCGTQFDEAPNQVWSLNASASLHGFICGCSWVSNLNMLWIQTEILLSHRALKAAPKGWPRCLVYIFVNHRVFFKYVQGFLLFTVLFHIKLEVCLVWSLICWLDKMRHFDDVILGCKKP